MRQDKNTSSRQADEKKPLKMKMPAENAAHGRRLTKSYLQWYYEPEFIHSEGREMLMGSTCIKKGLKESDA